MRPLAISFPLLGDMDNSNSQTEFARVNFKPWPVFFTKIIKKSKFFYVITSFFALESLVFFLKHYQAIYLHLFFEKQQTQEISNL